MTTQPHSPVPQRLPTRRDAAARLGVCVDTIDAYVKRGALKKITLSRRAVRIDPSSLERFATGAAEEVAA